MILVGEKSWKRKDIVAFYAATKSNSKAKCQMIMFAQSVVQQKINSKKLNKTT